jgi:hypothetical protein
MLEMRKDLFFGILCTFCLTAALFLAIPIRSQTTPEYDPWKDINDDGYIGIDDIVSVAENFGALGTPINKTELLLNLTAKMGSHPMQSGLLLDLPAFAYYISPTRFTHNAILFSIDVDSAKAGDQQSIFTLQGETISISGQYQIYDNGHPSAIRQLFFIFSWTPSWPPPNSTYYHALYDSVPGGYPGTGIQSFSFNITVPNEEGVYYLYFCTEAHYSIPQAVNSYKEPLFVPHAIILVGQ